MNAADIHHPSKKPNSSLRIPQIDCDVLPLEVHPIVEEEDVERLEFEELGSGEVLGYGQP